MPRTSPFSSSVFHTASALSAPSGHLPLEGEGFMSGIVTLSQMVHLRRFPTLFHTASPIQPPPLRGTSFQGRERPREPLPLEGAAERSEAGWLPFLRRSPLLFAFPIGERGPRSGTLVNGVLETISHSLSYRFPHPTSAPSGHLSLEGKALVSGIATRSYTMLLRRSSRSLSSH